MGNRRRAKIGAEQRNDRAHLSEPEPDREILGPIAHHEGDSFTCGHPGAQRPTRILVHPRFNRAEAKALTVADEGRRVAILAGPLGHCARQNAFGVTGRLDDGFQGPQPSASRRCWVLVVGSGRRDRVHFRSLAANSALCDDLKGFPAASHRRRQGRAQIEIEASRKEITIMAKVPRMIPNRPLCEVASETIILLIVGVLARRPHCPELVCLTRNVVA
jgi:hypothetical protein